MQKPLILVTNDDGINAPGIRILAETLSHLGDVVIVAPHTEQSATGLGITIRQPLKIHKFTGHSFESYSVTGTPADSVKMALSVILKRTPSLIVSGINRGSNHGRNILYSGTVSAVIEGSLREIPGAAFSCWDLENTQYERATKHIPSIVKYLLEHPLTPGTFLNVNFPSSKHPEIKGVKLTRQGKQYWLENPSNRSHPTENETYWWLGSKLAAYEDLDDSDVYWLNQGYATAVPVFVAELTHQDSMGRKAHFESFLETL